jgi:hypothetical protein
MIDKCSTPGMTHGSTDAECSNPVDKQFTMAIEARLMTPVGVTAPVDRSQEFRLTINYECSFNSIIVLSGGDIQDFTLDIDG